MPFRLSDEPEADDLLEPEYRPLYEAWRKKPGPATVGPLLNAVLPTLQSASRGIAGQDSGNAMSQAKQLALKGFSSYDPKRASLRTHLNQQMQGLKRITARANQGVSVPERAWLDSRYLQEQEQSLGHELGRDPSLAELSDHTGLSLERIAHVRSFHPGVMEAAVGGEDDWRPPTMAKIDPYHALVYSELAPIDQKIMEWSGFQGPTLPGNEIAKRLRLSAGAVSQRRAKIQKLLDEGDTLSPFS